MDPLKLLTRSTGLSKGAKKIHRQRQLPSGGASQNPRLFGKDIDLEDDHEQVSLRKRKRDPTDVEDFERIPDDLNFFHAKPRSKDGHATPEPFNRAESLEGDSASIRPSERMSQEECKRMLKAHKLKLAVLDDGRIEQNTPDSKKRKRKSERNNQTSSKKRLVQIYPEPLTEFSQLTSRYGISKRLVNSIEFQGFTVPTEVQLGSLPLLCGPTEFTAFKRAIQLSNHAVSTESALPNLLTVAPTGSGKTMAFLIPLIHSLQTTGLPKGWRPKGRVSEYMHWPRAVIIAPTRELAAQIVHEGRTIISGKVRLTLMRKGMKIWPQQAFTDTGSQYLKRADDTDDDDESDDEDSIEDLATNVEWEEFTVQPEIIVSTPLTLLNALKPDKGVVGSLENVQHLVLDEADVLLDALFRQQTLDIWQACTAPGLHVSLWSATMGSSIEEIAKFTIEKRIKSLGESTAIVHRPLIRLIVGLKDAALPTISQKLIYAATEQGKLLALRQMIHPTAPISSNSSRHEHEMSANLPALTPPLLVFTQTIPRAQALHSEILYDIPLAAGGSGRVACLHSSLPVKARTAILTRFRKGEVWILITTDLLARGMDFRGVNAVVNYDVPNSSAAYVHRVGRTGRAGREGGIAVTLYTKEDVGVVKGVANVIRASERLRREARGEDGDGRPDEGVPEWLMKALPSVSKNERKRLKRRGVEARREGFMKEDGKEGSAKMRISTKSGFDRRVENNRRGAVEGSRKRKTSEKDHHEMQLSESEFGGFDD